MVHSECEPVDMVFVDDLPSFHSVTFTSYVHQVCTGLILSQWVIVLIGASEIKCNTMGLFDGAMVHLG